MATKDIVMFDFPGGRKCIQEIINEIFLLKMRDVSKKLKQANGRGTIFLFMMEEVLFSMLKAETHTKIWLPIHPRNFGSREIGRLPVVRTTGQTR